MVLLAVAAPVHAAKNEIVLVADGPSYAVVTMPADVSLELNKSTVTGSLPWAMLVANQGPKVTAAVYRAPKRDVWNGESMLPKGRSTIRLVVSGKVTIRVPVHGMNGSRTIKLTKRLTDATAVVRDVPVVTETVTDDIPFKTRSDAVVVHGLTRRHDVPAAGVHSFCVAEAGQSCGPLIGTGSPGVQMIHLWKPRSSHAYVNHTGVGIGQLKVQHFVFAVPFS